MSSADRLLTAILFSLLAHTLLLFGIHFKPSSADSLVWRAPSLAVALVNVGSHEPPVNARMVAQAHSRGGGDEKIHDATSPQEADAGRTAAAPRGDLVRMGTGNLNHLRQRQAELEKRMETLRSDYRLPVHDTAVSARGGAQGVSTEMARISARVDRDWRAYQQQPRRVYLGPQAREHVMARYIEAWRLQVEAVGNRHYPAAARDQGLYGSLLLTVEISADGQVVAMRLERSSGIPLLDRAAQDIVRLAAPFRPFSPEMRTRADIVGITRTWIFTRDEGLTSRPY